MEVHMISVGMNRKLNKKIGLFNLPPGKTCPGATRECMQFCYAKKADRCYKSARDSRERNWEASKQPDFVAKFVQEVKDRGLTMVRLHESGDVYDQLYLDKILEICRQLPDVKFLMYTKSFQLNFSGAPRNLVIYWSTSDSSALIPDQGCKAHLLLKGQTPPAGYVTCDQGGLEKHYCGSNCTICWAGKQNVYFDQH
jgi:hypothetical protein